MKMFNNVLVGIDGTAGGRDAIALARQLADGGAQITLAHVDGGDLRRVRAGVPGAVLAEQEESHNLLTEERTKAGVKARLVSVLATSPGRGLHQQAEEQDADLIVVGSCRHGALGRAVLGDDTRAALNGAHCAVAVASRGFAERSPPIADVGVGYDGSKESQAALELARKLRSATSANVHVIEVVAIPTAAYAGMVAPVLGDSIDVLLQDATKRMRELGDVEAHAIYGLAGEELAAFSATVDIMVVGSRGYGPLRRVVLGSTSNYMQRHARSSLIVLPRPAARPAASITAADSRAEAAPIESHAALGMGV
jgi:nucleotide-binding universal stress UspA family protein